MPTDSESESALHNACLVESWYSMTIRIWLKANRVEMWRAWLKACKEQYEMMEDIECLNRRWPSSIPHESKGSELHRSFATAGRKCFSDATEHAQEPQLSELMRQEPSSSSSQIEAKDRGKHDPMVISDYLDGVRSFDSVENTMSVTVTSPSHGCPSHEDADLEMQSSNSTHCDSDTSTEAELSSSEIRCSRALAGLNGYHDYKLEWYEIDRLKHGDSPDRS